MKTNVRTFSLVTLILCLQMVEDVFLQLDEDGGKIKNLNSFFCQRQVGKVNSDVGMYDVVLITMATWY
jgi:hypothetical protein